MNVAEAAVVKTKLKYRPFWRVLARSDAAQRSRQYRWINRRWMAFARCRPFSVGAPTSEIRHALQANCALGIRGRGSRRVAPVVRFRAVLPGVLVSVGVAVLHSRCRGWRRGDHCDGTVPSRRRGTLLLLRVAVLWAGVLLLPAATLLPKTSLLPPLLERCPSKFDSIEIT
jgi:hypothetical protein